jgi:hypothetical protein
MKKLLLTSVVVCILLTACSGQESASTALPSVTPRQSSTATATLIPTKTSQSTLTPTQTLSPVPTWTSLPTIDPKIGKETLYTWFEGSENCHLPCWAGIIPGQTGWEEAWHLLQPLQQTVKLENGSNVDCVYGKCSFISWSRTPIERGVLSSIYPENIIDYIMLETIEPNHLATLSLKNILSIYGKPAILLFSTEPDQPGQKFLELILVYPERQFLIQYSKYADLDGDNLESCGTDSYIKLVVLDNREQLISLDVIANAVETRNFYVDVWHKSVEEATGMTIDTFYDTFSKQDAPCIITPINVWQP